MAALLQQIPPPYVIWWDSSTICHTLWCACLFQLFWFCPLPASCAFPASLLSGQYKKLKNWNVLGSVQPCSETTKTLVCYQHYFHPEIVSATVKKINSIPAKASTDCFCSVTVLFFCDWKKSAYKFLSFRNICIHRKVNNKLTLIHSVSIFVLLI